MKIRFGVGLGTSNVLGAASAFGDLVDLLEELRFDSLWISERATGPTLDPLAAIAFAAGRTRRMKFGTSVLVVPGRNPVLLAKELATVDAISGGRLLPAFGLGTPDPREHQAFGVSRAERSSWFEEAVPLMRRLWSEDQVTHEGPRFRVDNLSLWPKPVGRMEVWLGGRTPTEFDRAGRLAQGWLGAFQTPAAAARSRIAIETAAARHNRTVDDDHFGTVLLYARDGVPPAVANRLAARVEKVSPGVAVGEVVPTGAAEFTEIVSRYVAGGITKFVLVPVAKPASWAEELEWLAPLVREFEETP
jgi:probable F420-dependent oxidoreductase